MNEKTNTYTKIDYRYLMIDKHVYVLNIDMIDKYYGAS